MLPFSVHHIIQRIPLAIFFLFMLFVWILFPKQAVLAMAFDAVSVHPNAMILFGAEHPEGMPTSPEFCESVYNNPANCEKNCPKIFRIIPIPSFAKTMIMLGLTMR
jgi:hypothetical protein